MFSVIKSNNLSINQDVIDSYFIKAREIVRDWGNKLKELSPEKPAPITGIIGINIIIETGLNTN